ncbi:hypothetical protein R50072_26930 [Simiduia litorea]|uniref:hypothetical protein n=1 Tax=Simiduia litorea TaxID=1435348 RepID=UPI0036F28611
MVVSVFRLNLLRAMYLLIGIGLILSVWPGVFSSIGKAADSHTVVGAILVSFSLLALLGLRYPLKLLPILIFELIWKSLWLLGFALPAYLTGSMDEYTAGTTFACAMGVILTPLVIPWRYVVSEYLMAKGSIWR